MYSFLFQKVRPLVRKMQTHQQEYVIVNGQQPQYEPEAQQILVLNLAPSCQVATGPKISELQQQQQQLSGESISATTPHIPVNSSGAQQHLVAKPLNSVQSNLISLNAANGYRVINTLQSTTISAQKLGAVGKLPTRFRLINNGISTFNSHHLTPSVIKLNTLA